MEALETVQRALVLRRALEKTQERWHPVFENVLALPPHEPGLFSWVHVPLGLGSRDLRAALTILRTSLRIGLPTRNHWFRCGIDTTSGALFVVRRGR